MIAWREARTALIITIPIPTVRNTLRWVAMMERSVGSAAGTAAPPGAPPGAPLDAPLPVPPAAPPAALLSAAPAPAPAPPSPGRSAMRTASIAEASRAAMPTHQAPDRPMKWISPAAANGPMNRPMRITPPRVDSARARR